MTITDRQLEFLRAAVERGYFDTPKAVTLERLADDLGVSKDDLRRELRAAVQAAYREFWGKV